MAGTSADTRHQRSGETELTFAIWQAFNELQASSGQPRAQDTPDPPPLTTDYLTQRIKAAFNELDLRQLEIIRQMTPPQRLRRVVELNNSLFRLLAASVRNKQPDLDVDSVRQQVAERIGGTRVRTNIR